MWRWKRKWTRKRLTKKLLPSFCPNFPLVFIKLSYLAYWLHISNRVPSYLSTAPLLLRICRIPWLVCLLFFYSEAPSVGWLVGRLVGHVVRLGLQEGIESRLWVMREMELRWRNVNWRGEIPKICPKFAQQKFAQRLLLVGSTPLNPSIPAANKG